MMTEVTHTRAPPPIVTESPSDPSSTLPVSNTPEAATIDHHTARANTPAELTVTELSASLAELILATEELVDTDTKPRTRLLDMEDPHTSQLSRTDRLLRISHLLMIATTTTATRDPTDRRPELTEEIATLV